MPTIKSLRKYNEMVNKPLSWTFFSASVSSTCISNFENGLIFSNITCSTEETVNNLPQQPSSIHQYSETPQTKLWDRLSLIF